MDGQIKSIIDDIDELVTKVTEDGEEPSQEVLDGLEELSQSIALLKEKKQVDNSKELLLKLDTLIETITDGDKLSTDTTKSIVEAIKAIKIDVPQVNVAPPEVNVNVPEIKVPQVNVPETKIPEPKVYFPDEMSIKKPSWIDNLIDLTPILQGLKAVFDVVGAFKLPKDAKDAIPVRLSNGEKFYNAIGGMASAISGAFPFKKADSTDQAALVDDDGHVQVDVVGGDIVIDADQINLNTDTLEAKLQTLIDQTDAVEGNLTTLISQTAQSTTPTVYNKTLTLADTEYSQALPANTKQFRFRCRTVYDVRYSFETGKVATPTAPYLTLPAGSDYFSDRMSLASTTIYLASPQAGVVVEVECFT